MHLANRRRTMTEGAVVDIEFQDKEIPKLKECDSQHRRAHSVPISFDDLLLCNK